MNERDEVEIDAVMKVEKSGINKRGEDEDIVEEKKIQNLKINDVIVLCGFIALIGLVFGMQWLWQGENTGISNELGIHLVDMGGLLASSVLDGQWDRIFTYSVLHSDFMELLAVIIVFGLSGLLLEPHIGTARTTIVLLMGCLAGSLVTLVIGSDEVVVGVWSGVYAVWAAALYICLCRRSKMYLAFGAPKIQTLFVIGACGIAWGFSYVSLSILISLVIVGICTGLMIIHLLLASKSLFDPASRVEISVATGLVVVYGLGLTTSFWHFFTGL